MFFYCSTVVRWLHDFPSALMKLGRGCRWRDGPSIETPLLRTFTIGTFHQTVILTTWRWSRALCQPAIFASLLLRFQAVCTCATHKNPSAIVAFDTYIVLLYSHLWIVDLTAETSVACDTSSEDSALCQPLVTSTPVNRRRCEARADDSSFHHEVTESTTDGERYFCFIALQ